MTNRSPANILLCPVGSAGDVYPFVGLGQALKERGHDVTIVTSGYFRETAERIGLEFVDVLPTEDFMRLVGNPLLWHPLYGAKSILRTLTPERLRVAYDAIAERVEPGRTVIVSSCLGLGARLANEHLGVPLVTVDLQPMVLWSKHETPLLPGILRWAPGWFKQLQYQIGERLVLDPNILPQLNTVRRELDLAPVRKITSWWHSPDCILALFPEWYAARQPDWPAQVHLTNFPLWNERLDESLPNDVAEFLDTGEPPIAFTPGSGNLFGQQFFRAAVDACMLLNCRGMLFSKFDDHIPKDLPSSVRHFRYAPFQKVLPHCCAISHHGGIGTTAQAMQAAIPQLIMPLSHDQPDNAARIKRLGIGDWLKPRSYYGEAVAARLRSLLEKPSVATACVDMQQRICRIERPYARPCDVVESRIGTD